MIANAARRKYVNSKWLLQDNSTMDALLDAESEIVVGRGVPADAQITDLNYRATGEKHGAEPAQSSSEDEFSQAAARVKNGRDETPPAPNFDPEAFQTRFDERFAKLEEMSSRRKRFARDPGTGDIDGVEPVSGDTI